MRENSSTESRDSSSACLVLARPGHDIARRSSNLLLLLLASLAGIASSACQSGGVGDPCIPEDEYVASFPGYQATEVNVESQSFQCETRVCLVANFRGRVSCPYGQATANANQCFLPGASKAQPDPSLAVTAVVSPQLLERRPEQAVYCSCRCDGPDPAARYCQCPSGFTCQKLVQDIGKGKAQLAGSYCIKEGTEVTDIQKVNNGNPCDSTVQNCGDAHPYGI